MRLATSKIIFFSIILLFFGIGQTSDALNYSNNFRIYEESEELLAKEGGDGKKSVSKKSVSKKSVSKKSENKKNTNKKNTNKKSESSKKQSIINKVKNNQNAMKEAAKERYEIWKRNKKKDKI